MRGGELRIFYGESTILSYLKASKTREDTHLLTQINVDYQSSISISIQVTSIFLKSI